VSDIKENSVLVLFPGIKSCTGHLYDSFGSLSEITWCDYTCP